MIELYNYLILSALLFSIGVIGVLIRRNAIVIFMCIELMLNAINLSLVSFSAFLGTSNGQIFVFFVMTVAAAEAAVGLAIVISLFRNKESINIDDINIHPLCPYDNDAVDIVSAFYHPFEFLQSPPFVLD